MTKTIKEQAQILKEVILKNPNGFTCDFKGNLVNKKNGFFVSITDIKGKQINRLIKKILYIKQNGFKENKNLSFGYWKDEQNILYTDLSLYIEDLNLSKKIGKIFNQKAIFDIKNPLNNIYLK